MVSTRSGGGQDVRPVIRAHIANQHNPAPPPPVNQAMDAVDPKPHQYCATDASSAEPAATANSSATSATQG
jgi:hypothetical protein